MNHPGSPLALLDALRAVVGEAHLLTSDPDVAPYAEDWRRRYRGEPLCVALPGSTEEVAQIVRHCAAAGVPVLPQGGNTGLVGAATPIGGRRADGTAPVIVAMRRMHRIREIDTVGNTIVAEAGCVLQTLQEAADARGRLYAVTLGAEGSCQIGGNLSTNAGGTGVVKYGATRDQVLGLEMVLPDGRVWDGLRTLRKDNTGYALRHLVCGAEGTLGIVTAVSLRLHPKPAVWASAWLTMDTVDAALKCLSALQSIAGERICAWELLNRRQMQTVIEQMPEIRLPTDPEAPYAVLLELSDTYPKADLGALMQDALGELFEAGWLRDAAVAASEAQRASFWKIRHSVTESNRKSGMGLSTDVAVPVRALPEFIDRASQAVQRRYPQAEILLVSHMGDGNVHFIPRFSFDEWAKFGDRQAAVADEVRGIVHDEANALGGTFSAEHGVGHVLVGELERLRPPVELEMMRRIRSAWDPQGLFNRGKLLRG
ncbi:MAG: hypothetical protein RIS35_1970 [Pseudomonadota bacterium]